MIIAKPRIQSSLLLSYFIHRPTDRQKDGAFLSALRVVRKTSKIINEIILELNYFTNTVIIFSAAFYSEYERHEGKKFQMYCTLHIGRTHVVNIQGD
jgi:hypothetical protein